MIEIQTPDVAVLGFAAEELEQIAKRIADEKYGAAWSLVRVADWLSMTAFEAPDNTAPAHEDLTRALSYLKLTSGKLPYFSDSRVMLERAARFVSETRIQIAEHERDISERLKHLMTQDRQSA